MTSLLSKSVCGESEEATTKCQGLRRFESAKYVRYVHIELKPTNPRRRDKWPPLSQSKDQMIDALTRKLDEQFSNSLALSAVDALDPTMLPTDSAEAPVFKLNDIFTLAETFDLDDSKATEQWIEVLEMLCDTDIDIEYRSSGPVMFWSKVLGDNRYQWQAKPEINKLIRSVLVMPSGSVDAERGFSILKHIKYDRRSRLTAQSLDSLLRIRVNGPDIKDFNALHYAAKWHQSGKSLSDSTGCQKSASKEDIQLLNSVTDMVKTPEQEEAYWKQLQHSNLFLKCL